MRVISKIYNNYISMTVTKTKSIIVQEKNSTLSNLIEEVNQSQEATIITVDNNKQAVLISLEEWKSIQETLYLISIPTVKDDLIEGKNTPWEECLPIDK
jgi:prevent-host-death family protein